LGFVTKCPLWLNGWNDMGLTIHECLVAYVLHDWNIVAKPERKTQDALLWRLWTIPRSRAFFWFLQVGIPTHATFIDNFWDGFWTPSRLFSPKRFNGYILSVVPTLFSYHTRPHSTPNCMCPWCDLLLSHDQAFKWSSSHYNGGNIISTHKLCFMHLISRNLCNTLFPTLIVSYN
jgi:hypothetical protein